MRELSRGPSITAARPQTFVRGVELPPSVAVDSFRARADPLARVFLSTFVSHHRETERGSDGGVVQLPRKGRYGQENG